MKKHFNIRVSGKVQGVFFRQSTQDKAIELGITGWTRNEAEGTVYIEAEGEEGQLRRFIEWVKTGPPIATVHQVEINESLFKNYSSFDIRH